MRKVAMTSICMFKDLVVYAYKQHYHAPVNSTRIQAGNCNMPLNPQPTRPHVVQAITHPAVSRLAWYARTTYQIETAHISGSGTKMRSKRIWVKVKNHPPCMALVSRIESSKQPPIYMPADVYCLYDPEKWLRRTENSESQLAQHDPVAEI